MNAFRPRAWRGLRAAAAAWAVVPAAHVAGCAALPATSLPAAITPPAPHTLVMTVPARGVQVYECRATGGGAPQWAFVAPEATLLAADGRTVGSHGAGPHWAFDDGLRLLGRVTARADAASPGAIPWLLLAAWPEALPGDGSHRLAGVRSVVRANTHGGVAPATGCGPASLGRQVRVAYTADYLLYLGH